MYTLQQNEYLILVISHVLTYMKLVNRKIAISKRTHVFKKLKLVLTNYQLDQHYSGKKKSNFGNTLKS